MAQRFFNIYPKTYKKKVSYAKLLTTEDYAKLQYKKDMAFRRFVIEWNADLPELMGWTLTDFFIAYKSQGVQLKLFLTH